MAQTLSDAFGILFLLISWESSLSLYSFAKPISPPAIKGNKMAPLKKVLLAIICIKGLAKNVNPKTEGIAKSKKYFKE